MSLDLTADELEIVCMSPHSDWPDILKDKLIAEWKEREEIESLDMDDCAGGACKL